MFSFEIIKKENSSRARAGVIHTPHGDIQTPAFIPVGTKATLKALTPEQLLSTGAQSVLANTYHLYLQPGDELVQKMGGLHKFMNWSGPIFTDSGGFQVFSLGVAYGKGIGKVLDPVDTAHQLVERSTDDVTPLAKIGNDGVSFTSHIDGSTHYLTPERSIQIQHNLGADIIFAFDECTAPSETYEYQKDSLDRTHAWAKRSLIEHSKLESEKVAMTNGLVEPSKATRGPEEEQALSENFSQALYAVVQGSRYEDLRKDSAKVLAEMQTSNGKEFDGFGIGGSFNKDDIHTAVSWCNDVLPENKPKHLLGIGEPLDLILGIEAGIDTFDCVAPTRIARNGTVYVFGGRLNLMNTEFQNDNAPIENECGCYTCKNYSRAYLAHLFRAKEMLGPTLATIHNVYFINKLVADIRQAILDDKFDEVKQKILKAYK